MSTYRAGLRRTLLDMHIPDWDDAFMSRYDPAALASLYDEAGITSAMLYCKSHVGLCYWPTTAGRMHGGIGGRDVVGELVGHLPKSVIKVAESGLKPERISEVRELGFDCALIGTALLKSPLGVRKTLELFRDGLGQGDAAGRLAPRAGGPSA